jgi:hypothetical protein
MQQRSGSRSCAKSTVAPEGTSGTGLRDVACFNTSSRLQPGAKLPTRNRLWLLEPLVLCDVMYRRDPSLPRRPADCPLPAIGKQRGRSKVSHNKSDPVSDSSLVRKAIAFRNHASRGCNCTSPGSPKRRWIASTLCPFARIRSKASAERPTPPGKFVARF